MVSTPKAPTPPDPVATAAAQGQMNKDTAVAQANLNRIDQYTPQGSSTYSQTGTNDDGTPRYRQDTTYSPVEQQKYDQQNQVALALGGLATDNIGRVADTQAKSWEQQTAGATPMITNIGANAPALQTGPAAPTLNNLTRESQATTQFDKGPRVQELMDTSRTQTSQMAPGAGTGVSGPVSAFNPTTRNLNTTPGLPQTGTPSPQQSQTSVNALATALSAPAPQQSGATPTPAAPGAPTAPQQQPAATPTPQAPSATPPGAGIQSQIDMAGVPQAQTNIDRSRVGDVASGVDMSGVTGIANSGGIQRSLDYGGLSGLTGTDAAAGSAAANALYQQAASRLDPQFQQQEAQMRSRLAAQGISENSEAYRTAMDNFQRGKTDAYNQANFSAIQAGGAEASRQFADSLAARQQGQRETDSQGNFVNTSQGQQFAQDAANRGQTYSEAANNANYGLNAQGQQFSQAATEQQQQLAAQGQIFGQQAQRAEFANKAQNQGVDQTLGFRAADTADKNAAAAQASAAAAGTNASANMVQAQNQGRQIDNNFVLGQRSANTADRSLDYSGINDQFGRNLASATFDQNAGQQGFENQLAAGTFNNASDQQRFNQVATALGINNAAAGQQFNQNLASANFNNNAAGQIFGQNLAAAQFYNQGQDQVFSQDLARNEFNNNNAKDTFQMGQQAATQNNQARAQVYNEDGANATLNNAARQQQIAEAAYSRNLPINDIAALLGTGGGVQQPTFGAVPQVGVAAPDYMGAVNNNYNGAVNQYNQQMAARNSGLGAIFGTLGSIGGAVAMSDKRLKWDIKPVGFYASGIPTYAFKYLGSVEQQFGVMAQDVLPMFPEAISVNDNGMMAVDYSKVA